MEELFNNPSDKIAAFAAVLGIISLFVSIYSAWSTKKYAKEQIELTKQQFVAASMPDIEANVFCQRKNPNSHDFTMGLFLEATNHSQSISVNKITVTISSEPFGESKGFGNFFLTFDDLKPGQKIKMESFNEYEKMVENSFPPNTVEDSVLARQDDSFYTSLKDYEKYPATINISYLPRITGANEVKKEEQVYLLVKRKAA